MTFTPAGGTRDGAPRTMTGGVAGGDNHGMAALGVGPPSALLAHAQAEVQRNEAKRKQAEADVKAARAEADALREDLGSLRAELDAAREEREAVLISTLALTMNLTLARTLILTPTNTNPSPNQERDEVIAELREQQSSSTQVRLAVELKLPAAEEAPQLGASSTEIGASSREVRASSREVRASSREVGASSPELGASSSEIGASATAHRSEPEPPAPPAQRGGLLRGAG